MQFVKAPNIQNDTFSKRNRNEMQTALLIINKYQNKQSSRQSLKLFYLKCILIKAISDIYLLMFTPIKETQIPKHCKISLYEYNSSGRTWVRGRSDAGGLVSC